MLREIPTVKPDPGHAFKQWFTDEAMDLFVWRNSEKRIEKFQLAYKKAADEYALTWTEAAGFTVHFVDDGESRTGRYKATPILLPTHELPLIETTGAFLHRAEQLEPVLRDFVRSRLEDAVLRQAHE